jgi:hypothetical protein
VLFAFDLFVNRFFYVFADHSLEGFIEHKGTVFMNENNADNACNADTLRRRKKQQMVYFAFYIKHLFVIFAFLTQHYGTTQRKILSKNQQHRCIDSKGVH